MWTWFLVAAFGIVAFVYFYWFVWRPFAIRRRILKLDLVYARLDQIEAGWWGKFRITVSGLKRKAVVHLTAMAGLLPFLHDTVLPWLGAQDITPFVSPESQWMVPLAMTAATYLLSWLISLSPQSTGEVNPGVVEDVVAKSPGDDATLSMTAWQATEKK